MRFSLLLAMLVSLAWSTESYSQSKKVESHGPTNGTLLVIGGAASDIFYEKFMEPIRNAAGIWFSGGRQWRYADSYLGTLTHKAFFELLEKGGVIAESSAGATIQGSYLARGDTKKNTIMMGDHEEGLGFIPNLAIDQHLLARNRQFDMFEILENRPELLGIGLDEDTGIIVEGDQFTVFGNSYVAIYDGTRWSAERDTIYALPEGSRDFYMLHEGERYDLLHRKVITD